MLSDINSFFNLYPGLIFSLRFGNSRALFWVWPIISSLVILVSFGLCFWVEIGKKRRVTVEAGVSAAEGKLHVKYMMVDVHANIVVTLAAAGGDLAHGLSSE